jgi:UDP-N-acetyl-D-glucosamine dehydrogenase
MIPRTREHVELSGRLSVALSDKSIGSYDALIVSTDHDAIDYALVTKHARLLVDTRNVCARHGVKGNNIVKA